ncbi:dihydroneopterin aldolase [Pararhodobacter oceanensis]|uniref:dihydroneopterin aldolase n=1 Tax=Pararhodobacter oceanensis TaxID=2172121 RepID=A0A2T8HVV8_9RHOB|nr:dihydroneopterin aldolase [Pararhodobacter oceanensis]PVH29524.1 diguanylate cyclase [Pararhodobacter oceanensis]
MSSSSSSSHLAFAHPEERAAATASADPRDRISLRDYMVDVEIGAFQTERGLTQRLMFNIVVEVQPQAAPLDDDVDKIMSYDRITEAISDELAAGRVNLLETLAEHVAERILAAPQAMRAFVRIEKLDRGPFKLGVDIVRTRAATPVQAQTDDGAVLHPVVAFFDNAMIADAALVARVAGLEARGAPLVLCVGMPEVAPAQVGIDVVQKRIDLLAIEQNAWVLAARNRDWLVVDSRTEIDWAIRQGKTIVWAPPKLVLDAVDSPLDRASDGAALALWLAEELAAQALVMPEGQKLSAGSRVPVETFAEQAG